MIVDLKEYGFDKSVYARDGYSDIKVVKEIFETKIYYKKKIGFDVESGETWIDMGANAGYFGAYCQFKGAKPICVEADPQNHDILEKNLCHGDYQLIKKAVIPDNANFSHVTFFQRQDGMSWKSSLFKVAKSKKIKVPTVKFQELLTQDCCVKMDIEGIEMEILENCEDFSKINKMAFEWSFDKDMKINRLRKVIDKLEKSFKTVFCPQTLPRDHQLWPGKANAYALVYCKR